MSTNCRLERPTAVIMPASRDGGRVAGGQGHPRCWLGAGHRGGLPATAAKGVQTQPKPSKLALHPLGSPAPEALGGTAWV